jgi:hypothetical protein
MGTPATVVLVVDELLDELLEADELLEVGSVVGTVVLTVVDDVPEGVGTGTKGTVVVVVGTVVAEPVVEAVVVVRPGRVVVVAGPRGGRGPRGAATSSVNRSVADDVVLRATTASTTLRTPGPGLAPTTTRAEKPPPVHFFALTGYTTDNEGLERTSRVHEVA